MTVTLHWRHPRELLIWGSRFFVLAGCVALGYWAFTLVEGAFYRQANDARFDLSIPSSRLPNVTPPPLRLTALEGRAISRMDIPRLGMSVLIAEGASARTLRLAAGHIPGTAFPDEVGNIGIAGHRDTFFRPLRKIAPGDTVVLVTPGRSFRYRVEWTRIVRPEEVDVLRPSSEPVLTLVTCYPFYFVGKAPQRFIVRARRIPGNAE